MKVAYLVAYWYFCWASRDIPPQHPDVLEVAERRRHYADLLGIADVPVNRPVPAWFPQHWNCRCRAADPLPPPRPLPR